MILQIENITKRYGRFTAVNNLNLVVERGCIFGLVGPNGAGKTTTMRIISTLLPADSGEVLIDGISVREHPLQASNRMGYVPDFFGVYDKLKVDEYLDFYGNAHKVSADKRKEAIPALLELVNLSDRRNSYVNELSRGMQQRLCLARAMIHDPDLLIMDEPASGMDPRARAEMKGILRALRDMGKTIVISSHILPEMAELCDAVAIMDHGVAALVGTMDQVLGRSYGASMVDIQLIKGVDEAILSLRELAFVTGVQADGNYLKVAFKGGDEQQAELLTTITARGAAVTRFVRNEANLERVFLEVTGQ
jgi:ABC-2 type transport system ATP-binding protein